MKKLTVALVLVALLTLPMVGLAGPPSDNPPKPGTGENPGLWVAWDILYSMSNPGFSWIGGETVWLLLFSGPPAWASGK